MPTVPRDRPEIHRLRTTAESFGVNAERYDRARPPYPDAMIARVVAASPGTDLVDVGCGTGIEARQFQAAGCHVLGVEPDERMAEFARHRGLEVEVARFEEWDDAGRTFDAVVSGTAWHWIDPVAGPAKALQVLRPGGVLAIFGHSGQGPPEVLEAFGTAMKRVRPDSPFNMGAMGDARDGYQAMYAVAAEKIHAAGFAEPDQWRYDWERAYTRDEYLDMLPTSGGLTGLEPDKLKEVLAAVGDAIDSIGGRFTVPYATVGVTAVRP